MSLQLTVALGDAAIVFFGLMAVALIYPVSAFDQLVAMGASAAVMLVAVMALRGGYRIAYLARPRKQALLVAQAWGVVFFVAAWLAFLFKATEEFSRGTVSLWFVLGGGALVGVHGIGAWILAKSYARGTVAHSRVAVIAIADESAVGRIVERLSQKGVAVAAASLLAPHGAGSGRRTGDLASAAQAVRTALASGQLDGVWVFASWADRRRIDEVKAAMSSVPVPVYVFADHELGRMLDRPLLRIGDFVGLELRRAPLDRFDLAAKRALDIVVAAGGLLLLSPLMAMVAAAIVIESGFPILFRQHRKGFGARPFAILKFRSMRAAENGREVRQATRDDARITLIGRIIRRTSIDELPQLINVLKGEMSIVGPRPHALAHDDLYDGLIATYALRQHVKPGITGWAQINGLRGETRQVEQMSRRVEHDLWYIDNWSLWLDIRIIVLTALKVVFDETAY